MKNTQDFLPDEFDDFFKKSFEDPKMPFDPEAWKAMEKKLDDQPLGAWEFWNNLFSGIFVVGLLLSVIVMENDSISFSEKRQMDNADVAVRLSVKEREELQRNEVATTRPDAGKIRTEGTGSDSVKEIQVEAVGRMSRVQEAKAGKNTDLKVTEEMENTENRGSAMVGETDGLKPSNKNGITAAKTRFNEEHNEVSDGGNDKTEDTFSQIQNRGEASAISFLTPLPYDLNFKELKEPEKEVLEVEVSQPKSEEAAVVVKHDDLPKFSLNFKVSPDFSAVDFLGETPTGSNIGFVIEYYLSPRWRLSTGIINSKKIYVVNEKDAYGYSYGSQPTLDRIEGDCDVLDIPLNLRFNAWNHPTGSFFLSGGLSSYLMLKEDYSYRYSNPGYTTSRTVKGENNHFFSVLNFSLGYEKSLGKRVALELEPFAKIPLKEIGAGNLKLKSAGAFLTFKYKMY